MKKYLISKSYMFTLMAFIVLIAIPWIVFLLYALDSTDTRALALVMLAIIVCVLPTSLYMLFFDFYSGTVEFDEQGIRQRIGRKTVNFAWDDFFEYKFLSTTVDRGGNKLWWICCSTEYLSDEDERSFLRRHRKKRDKMVFFQYNEKVFNAFMTYIDEEYRAVLRKEEKDILANMRFMERLYNR